ncbi:MAG TPA: NifU family protein [Verrucomicrobiae bacterium]|jgi:Fe-S cluster biogenesis protein NfuA
MKTPSDGIHQEGRKLQDMIARIEQMPDAEARDLTRECLQSVLTLHGEGLERMLLLIKNAGAAGREISEALQRDKLTRGLLLIHGLHPVPLARRLADALDKVRPYMQSHGGNVELLSLENDVATLRLQGACKTCPSSAVTLELAVRQAVEEACPDLLGFEVEGSITQEQATEHTPNSERILVRSL